AGGAVNVSSTGTLGGTATINRNVDVSSGGTITGGNIGTVGTLTTTGNHTWGTGSTTGTYQVDMTSTSVGGFDLLTINGNLTLSSPTNSFVIKLSSSGVPSGFSQTSNYLWTIATANNMSSIDLSKFNLQTSTFTDEG